MLALLLGLAAMQGGSGDDLGYMGYTDYIDPPTFGYNVGYTGYSTYGDYGGYGGYGGWGPPINYIWYNGHVIPASPSPLPMAQMERVGIAPLYHGHHHPPESESEEAEKASESSQSDKKFSPTPKEDKDFKFPPLPKEAGEEEQEIIQNSFNKPILRDKALVIVQVPADAKVTLNGQEMQTTGNYRTYTTPTLRPNRRYAYTVRVELRKNGRLLTDSKRVEFEAGRYAFVSFDSLK